MIVELCAGLGYLIGNALLSRNALSGWVVKIIGGVAWILFLALNQNYIFMASTTVVVMTMIYGFFEWKHGTHDVRTLVDVLFEIVAVVVAGVMIGRVIFFGAYTAAPFFEAGIVIAEIFGTVLLARKRMLGWYCYIIMSVLVGILVIVINRDSAPVLGLLELSSIYFYLQGVRNFSHRK